MKKIIVTIILIYLFLSSYGQLVYSESFETGLGGWIQLTNDDFDWTHYSGPTPSPGTGPEAAADGNYYLYIEATGNCNPGKTAVIESPTFNFTSVDMPIFSFQYHMYGLGIGVLRLYAFDGYEWTEVWNDFENRGNQWNTASVCLRNYANLPQVKFRFSASTFFSDSSDIAIDDIKIMNFKIQSISKTDVSCGGYNDGTITISLIGGFAPYQYSIDDGVTYTSPINDNPYTFTNLNGKDYVIRVKDKSGCIVGGDVVTLNEPPIADLTVNRHDVFPCAYSHNGYIEIIVNQWQYPPYTYSINGFEGPFYTDNIFDNLDTGTYTIAVKNSIGCITVGQSIKITAPNDINIYDLIPENITTCYGDCNGELQILAGGGTWPLTYSIDEGNNYQYSNKFTGLCAGNYRVYVKDKNNCIEISDYIEITQPIEVQITNVVVEDVQGCYGDANGKITIYVTGGTPPYLYSINNGATYFSDNVFNNLAAGNYRIRVKDSKNCEKYYGQVTINQPELLKINEVITQDVQTCYGDTTGVITINVSGGTGQIYYSIDNGNNFRTTNIFQNLPAGTYYPYVKDQNNCYAIYQPVSIYQPQQLIVTNIFSNNVSDCYGSNTGSIQIFSLYGTPPYYYSIDSGQTYSSNNTFNNLYAGTYHIFVKDDQNCAAYGGFITIEQPPQILITEQRTTDVLCYGNSDGTIYVDATGGTGQLYYSIDGGQNYAYPVGTYVYKRAGAYEIKVKDQNNCVVSGNTLVINQPDSLYISSVIVENVQSCYGDSTGSITINVVGGVAPYIYSIRSEWGFIDTNYFGNLPATYYFPHVVDNNGCEAYYQPVVIDQPAPLVYLSATKKDIDTCAGIPIGQIHISAYGGTGTLYYSIDSGQTYFANNGHFYNLYAGKYKIKIKDENNCSVIGPTIQIFEPPVLVIDSITTQNVRCFSQTNGSARIYAHGGQPQLMYSIDSGNIFIYSNFFANLSAGVYNVVVKDAYNCKVYSQFEILQPPLLVIDSIKVQNVETCYGDNSGRIEVYAQGGVPPLMYSYYRIGFSSSPYQYSNVFDSLYAGGYFVNVIDKNNCLVMSESFSITQPTVVKIDSVKFTNITCNNANDGTITIYSSGGTGSHQYSIDNGLNWADTNVFTNLAAGQYIIKVKDANNCLCPTAQLVQITQPNPLVITNVFKSNPTCVNYENGVIRVYIAGGTPPYYYILNDTIINQSGLFNNLKPGTYTITVQDNRNCTAIYSSTITLTSPPVYSEFSVNITQGCSPLSVQFSQLNTSSPLFWDFGDGIDIEYYSPLKIFENYSDTVVSFRVVAKYIRPECIDSSQVYITVFPQPQPDFSIDYTPHILPDSVVHITNLTTNYQYYFWDFGDGTTYEGVQPPPHKYPTCGAYLIKMIAKNSYECESTKQLPVQLIAEPPIAYFEYTPLSGCQPLTVNFVDKSEKTVYSKWYINNTFYSSDSTFEYTFENYGNQIISLRAIGYCGIESATNRIIEVYPKPIASFTILNDTLSTEGTLNLRNNSVFGSEYLWLFGDGNYSNKSNPEPYKYSQPGLYTITLIVYSDKGCVDTMIKENAVLVSDKFIFAMPTAFTPDGDGINDLLVPQGFMIKSCILSIYNRRGQIIFRTDKWNSVFWDGKVNGKEQPVDVYFWKADIEWIDGRFSTEFGSVTLLR